MTPTSLISRKRSISPAKMLTTQPAPLQSISGVRKSPRLATSVKGKPPCVGIDLGTTYARVSVYQHGKVEIIADNQGSRSTPSCVAFSNNQRLIGEEAKNQAALNPLNTVFGVKRILGCQRKDVDEKRWPFEVVTDEKTPKIKVNYKGEMKTFFAEEISSIVLQKMKQTAEAYLGREVIDVVISVPANFNDSQRQATRDAGTIAGLNVVRILNDPTAAAIAYGMEKKMEGEETVLIIDLGGGTLDVSIVAVGKFGTKKMISVKSTAGNAKLGGLDFDNRMVAHFSHEFYSKHKKDLLSNAKSLHRLRLACDQAKRFLSHANQATIAIDALYENIDFTACITRARFEYLCADLFRSILDIVKKALNDAGISKDMLDEVILIGGSSRIPKIQKLLRDFFGRRALYYFHNSDEAVANGAAIQAAILRGDTSDAIQGIQLSDVAPLTWDLLLDDGVISSTSCIVKRNSKIPRSMQVSVSCTARCPNQLTMKAYEGEEFEVNGETRREFDLVGLPLATPGVSKTYIFFDIDANGLLNINATENANGHLEKHTIKHDQTRLSSEEIDKLVTDAAYQRDLDNLWLERLLARNSLESYCLKMIEAVENQQTDFAKPERTAALDKCYETIKWIDDNHPVNQEKFEEKLDDVKNVCKTMNHKVNSDSENESEDSDYDVSDIDSDDEEDLDSDEDDSADEEPAPIKRPKQE